MDGELEGDGGAVFEEGEGGGGSADGDGIGAKECAEGGFAVWVGEEGLVSGPLVEDEVFVDVEAWFRGPIFAVEWGIVEPVSSFPEAPEGDRVDGGVAKGGDEDIA